MELAGEEHRQGHGGLNEMKHVYKLVGKTAEIFGYKTVS